jgi:hypothetical protein
MALHDSTSDIPPAGELRCSISPACAIRELISCPHCLTSFSAATRLSPAIPGAEPTAGLFSALHRPASRLRFRTIDIWRVDGDRLAERWDVIDLGALEKQLRES